MTAILTIATGRLVPRAFSGADVPAYAAIMAETVDFSGAPSAVYRYPGTRVIDHPDRRS